MHDGCGLHTLLSQVLVALFLRSKDLLEDKRTTLLAGADLIDKNLSTNVLELVTGASWTSAAIAAASLFLLLSLCEVAKDFLSVFVYAVKEKIFDFNLI